MKVPPKGMSPHCLRIPKIFDWVNRTTSIKLREKIQIRFESENHSDDCSFQDIKKVNCFLSDRHGHSVSPSHHDTIECSELTSPKDRTDIQTWTPKGNAVTLQRVDLLKQGFVTVQLLNQKEQVCLQRTLPFSEVETLLLYAPPGIDVDCELLETDCKAHIIPPPDKCSSTIEVVIIILLCQHIVAQADVKVEIMGITCKPRSESVENLLCPDPAPPESCFIFPNS
ncbi:hypothetical protein ACFOU2_22770 [Bacillus songklensis]|uniref:Uncharacterized protein n=1 Tax=Bacillus songklensis TaxID=1069116 RepID=A0ABV8B751_9BACI